MTDTEKLRGWIKRAADEGILASERWIQAVDKLGAGTYEPKDALSDWYYFASRWLTYIPDPETASGPPSVSLSVHAGQDSAAGTQRIAQTNATPQIAGDLVNMKDTSKTIAKSKLTPALYDGGTTLLITASGLKALALPGGTTYVGQVTDGSNPIAKIKLFVWN